MGDKLPAASVSTNRISHEGKQSVMPQDLLQLTMVCLRGRRMLFCCLVPKYSDNLEHPAENGVSPIQCAAGSFLDSKQLNTLASAETKNGFIHPPALRLMLLDHSSCEGSIICAHRPRHYAIALSCNLQMKGQSG